jgi:hypothetical protein
MKESEAFIFAKKFLKKDAKKFLIDELSAEEKNAVANGTIETLDAAIYQAFEKAAKNPDSNDYDALILMAGALLRRGDRLPDFLATFSADVLEGKRKRPTKRGPDSYANWMEHYQLFRAVEETAKRFGMPAYTNNELSTKETAAYVVSCAKDYSLDIVHNAYRKFISRG